MESVCTLRLGLSFLMKSISKNKQSNLPWHFLKIAAILRFRETFASYRMFVFSNALEKVSGCVTDIIYIAQIT